MASCSSRSARDRELRSGSSAVDVDTYQAAAVCILAHDVCKSPFQVMGRQNRTPATIPRREYRSSNSILLRQISTAAAELPARSSPHRQARTLVGCIVISALPYVAKEGR